MNSRAFLAEELAILIRHFGFKHVQTALKKLAPREESDAHATNRQPPARANGMSHSLDSIRASNPEKYDLLDAFLRRLKAREVLPQAQDIRYFAQQIGLKEIIGKSRDELIPKLMRFMIEQPIHLLRGEIQNSESISEEQRRLGFSVLADKIVGRR